MKKILCAFLAVMLAATFSLSVFGASAEDMSFAFDLSVDGKQEKQVQTGDVITVVLYLDRTDADESYTMKGMQSEIRYDGEFFEIVMGSWLLGKQVITNADFDRDGDGNPDGPIHLRDNHREFYMNHVSMSGGSSWSERTLIGSFQLKVIATTGVAVITNEDVSVSLPGGSGSYACSVNSVTVVLSEACLISFNTNGGSPVETVTVNRGQKVTRPQNPTKEGYYFAGWYQDFDCTVPWDFETDLVEKNATIYAKWSTNPDDYDSGIVDTTEPGDGAPRGDSLMWLVILLIVLLLLAVILLIILLLVGRKIVEFDTDGGTEVPSIKVRKNGKITRPAPPIKDGYTFAGWAKDPACTIPWRFDIDTVKEDMTLYARWK